VESDEALASRAQQGDSEAWLILIDRYYPLIFRYLYRLSESNRMLAEDLTQDVFFRVQRALPQYAYPRPFKTWIYAIATNRMRDYWSLLDTQKTDNADALHPIEVQADEHIEEGFIDQETIGTVRSALKELPRLQREVVILYYYEELTQNEIASLLNIPTGTVKSRLFTGLHRLKAILEGLNDENKPTTNRTL
jgi:RNA polymerase sigma-70 factor, ECF subfamily